MHDISNLDVIVYVFAGLLAAFLSSVSGGGGGFITTPLLIFLGLSPAQAVSTGKISGLAIAIGSISGLRKGGVKYSKKQVIILCILSAIVGAIVPFVLLNLKSTIFQKALGVLLIIMIPFVLKGNTGEKSFSPTRKQQGLGYFLMAIVMFVQGMTSTGVGIFINIILMRLLGLKILTANIVKRYSQLILNSIIVASIIFSGLINWKIAIIGVIVNLIGGHFGGKYATKISTKSAKYFFVIFMLISGIALIVT